jgi:hypothetical protein
MAKRVSVVRTLTFVLLSSLILFSSTEAADVSTSPRIISAKVEPEKVRPKDVMTITAEVKDDSGIKSVTADMGGIETIKLELKEGSIYQGVWEKQWVVHDTEVK